MDGETRHARTPACPAFEDGAPFTSNAGEYYAMLQLLATYGLRSGEIRNLLLEDIDWRA